MDSQTLLKKPKYFSGENGNGCIEYEPFEYRTYCSKCHLKGSINCHIFGHPEEGEVCGSGLVLL